MKKRITVFQLFNQHFQDYKKEVGLTVNPTKDIYMDVWNVSPSYLYTKESRKLNKLLGITHINK